MTIEFDLLTMSGGQSAEHFLSRKGSRGTMTISDLSPAQLEQRAGARKSASILRKRRQMRRLYDEYLRVQQTLIEMGVEVDAAGRSKTELVQAQRTTASDSAAEVAELCSQAGAALRRCAEAKQRASTTHRAIAMTRPLS